MVSDRERLTPQLECDFTGKTMINRVLLALLAVAFALPVQAQSWPQRSVKLIIPLGPGAGADIVARLLADRLQKRWGQPVVVENRPGGDAIPALTQFTTANDDHTMLVAPASTFIAHPLQYAKLAYNPKDVMPVARVSNTVVAISVPVALGVSNLAEFVAIAKKDPGKLNFHAITSLNDLQFQAFLKIAGLDVVRVPYRDGVQALNDLAENRIQAYSSAFAVARPQVQAGKVKVIAVTNTQRTDTVPGVATATEQGHPALEFDGLVGFFSTPIINLGLREKIAKDVVEFSGDAEIVSRLTATAQIVNPGGPTEFGAALDRQRAGAAETVRIVGFKAAQ